MKSAARVLEFWFAEHSREQWFGGGPAFDAKLFAPRTKENGDG